MEWLGEEEVEEQRKEFARCELCGRTFFARCGNECPKCGHDNGRPMTVCEICGLPESPEADMEIAGEYVCRCG